MRPCRAGTGSGHAPLNRSQHRLREEAGRGGLEAAGQHIGESAGVRARAEPPHTART